MLALRKPNFTELVNPEGIQKKAQEPSPKGYTKQLDNMGSSFAELQVALLNLSFTLSRVLSGRLALMRPQRCSESWSTFLVESG